MKKFLVISEHTREDCVKAVQHFKQYHMNFMTHFEWGCKDGDHRAYAFVDAESHDHARMAVPPALRDKSRAVCVVRFTEKDLKRDPHKNPAAY